MADGADRIWRGDWTGDEPDERHLALTRGVRSTAGIPDDARLLGLDRNTAEGAMVGFAGSLSGSHLAHRVIAWVLLAVLVGPWLWSLLRQIL